MKKFKINFSVSTGIGQYTQTYYTSAVAIAEDKEEAKKLIEEKSGTALTYTVISIEEIVD